MKRVLASVVSVAVCVPLFVLAAGESTDTLGDGNYVKKDFDYYFNSVKANTKLGGYDDVANEGPIMTASLVINLLLGLLGTVALCLMVYAGFIWLMARGNEEQVTKAKDMIIGTVIGLLVILGSYSFMYYVFRSWVNITN